MRLVFTPAQEEEFYLARDELADAFLAWAEQRGLAVDPFVVVAALDYRYGMLSRWGRSEVRALLTEWFPRKITMLAADHAGIAPSLHVMVDFLADTGLLAAGSADVADLHAEIDKHTPALLARMADERNYDLGKFWGTKMLDHGVDLSDDAAVQRFIAAAHAGELDVDEDVLQEIVQRQFFSPPSTSANRAELPPVLLPGPEELSTAAEATVLLTRLRAFVGWLGTGRTLTKVGRLTLADSRELAELLDVDRLYLPMARSSAELPDIALLLHWAKAVRLVRTVKGRLVPIKAAAPLLRKPFELWQRAFDAVEGLGDYLPALPGGYQVPSVFGAFLPDTLPVLWLGLYTAGSTSIPMELLHQIVWEALDATYKFGVSDLPDDVHQELLRRDVYMVLAALEVLGAIRLTKNTDQAARTAIAKLSGRNNPDIALVGLTPIGLWAVNRALRAEGVDAPAAGELASKEIEVVCDRLVGAAPDAVQAELAAWVAARGTAVAASELATFIQHAERPSERMFGIAALAEAGERGLAAGREIRAAGGVAGAMVTSWLMEQDALDPGSLTEAELLLGLVDHLAALHDQGCLVEELAQRPVAEQLDLVRRLAQVEHPYLLPMLDALATEHPDREVARKARKARMALG